MQDWQQRWEQFNRSLGSADQTTQVERARIEQLENQLRRLTAQADRLALERDALSAQESNEQLGCVVGAGVRRREPPAKSLPRLSASRSEQVQTLRTEQFAAEKRLEAARGERERARAELTSLEAVQKAALTDNAGGAAEWLGGAGLTHRPRVAQTLEVESGWERAVETALGDYLEAVCVDDLDGLAEALGGFLQGPDRAGARDGREWRTRCDRRHDAEWRGVAGTCLSPRRSKARRPSPANCLAC